MKSFIKKTLAVLLSATLLFSVVPLAAAAAETTVQESVGASSGTTGECTWTLDDNGVLTISGNGEMGVYNYDYNYTHPWGDNITSVIINDGVTSIGGSAFSGCTGLTSVTIGDSVTSIGNEAFSGCTGLTSVTIPDSVTSIGDYAFRGCTNKDLVISCVSDSVGERYAKAEAIPVIVYESIDDGSAYRLTAYPENKTDVEIPATFAGKPVTSLGKWLFKYNSKIQTVSISDSVTEIPRGAFYNCTELKTVTMGNGVKTIAESAFEKCLFLENITLSNQLETIGDEAFYDCRRLRTLDIPDSVKTIGEEAFTNCRSLTSLNIPDGVGALGSEDSVGYGMFENCKNLREITVPASVAYIQKNAFDGCDNVTILGKQNSYAQDFAAKQHILFKIIDADECMVGDVSGDGNVDITDATIVQQFAAEVVVPTAAQKTAADTNHDGAVDITDATMIQMYAAEIIHSF